MQNSVWKKLTEEPEDPKHVNTFYGIMVVAFVFLALVFIPFVLLK